MKKFLLPALAALLALPALARDFTYTYEGQSLVYTVTDETAKTCMVKCGAPLTVNPDEETGELSGYYLRGEMNGWDATEEWEFRTTDTDGEYIIRNCTLSAGGFKVADANFELNCGGAYPSLDGTPCQIYNGAGSNCLIYEDFTGDIIFNIKHIVNLYYEYYITFVPEYSKIIKGRLDIPAKVSDGTNEYTVTRIADKAFYQYTGMTSVTLPNTVVSIGNLAFACCSGLNNVQLSGSLQEIGNSAFSMCSALETIDIPSSVNSIDKYAFTSCAKLEAINVDDSNKWYSSVEGCLVDKGTATLIKCPEGKKGDLVVPSSVTSIEFGAIQDCNVLGYIKIPNSVKELPKLFAYNCAKLQTVSLPAAIEKIGAGSFLECPDLYEINVEEGCKNYYSLDGVLFSNIDNNTTLVKFPEAKGLYTYYPEGYNIPEGVKTIGETAFYKAFLNYVNIPSTVTSIGADAFELAILESITIPSSVESIGNSAFYQNSQLTSVSIPSSVKTFGENIFSGCSMLANVYYNTDTPVAFEDPTAFISTNATLFIRSEGVEAAKTTAPWSKFKNIVAYDFDNINNKDYYLVGDFNDWTNGAEDYKFTPVGNGDYELDYTGTLVEFKITDGTWDEEGCFGLNRYSYGIYQGGSRCPLVQPGDNISAGTLTGLVNPHFVFNPSERILSYTCDFVELSYTYQIWGNFPAGGDEWAAIGMRSDNNDGLWTAKNVVAENECQFLLRQMRDDGKILFWGHSTDGALITGPGTYVVGWQDYNFSITPGTWDLMYDERTGMLTVSAASGSVDGIEVDDNVAPVYYNLQGVRVDNPASGLYIVVRGSKTTKEYIK